MNKSLEYDISPISDEPPISVAKEKVVFKYIAALDGMRAIAVLLVVFFHAILVFPTFQPFFNGGFWGVNVFCFERISGYLDLASGI